MTLKILLTGKNGQVGRELNSSLQALGEVIALDHTQLDLTNPTEIRDAIRSIRPQLIVNAAAYTAVDLAESDEGMARAVNSDAPRLMAEEAREIGAGLVHYSTDYVFDGLKTTPYLENDPTNPINVYGRTKLAGEHAIQESGVPHLIFRTSWVYGREGKNFLRTILRLATQKEELKIVHDQIGAPTSSHDIALATTEVLSQLLSAQSNTPSLTAVSGLYHMTASGETNWFEFTKAILDEAARNPRDPWVAEATNQKPMIARSVVPITAAEYPTPAKRPSYSMLSNSLFSRTFGFQMVDWRTQLNQCFAGKHPTI